MNIPSKIKIALPSIILESNSSNNAIWGQIFGDINNQTDLHALIEDSNRYIFKLSYVTLSNPVSGANETINITDLQPVDREAKIGDLFFGMVKSAADNLDYYIFASISTISSQTTVDCDIEYSIKQIDYVHDDNYVHTDNNYTDNEKTKLAGIEAEAEKNVQSDFAESDSTSDSYIKNKPLIGGGKITIEKNAQKVGEFNVNQTADANISISLNKSDVGLSNVNNTSDVDKPVSNATQYQLNLVNNSISDIQKLIPTGTNELNQLVNQQLVTSQIGDANITFKLNNSAIKEININQFTDDEVNYVLSKNDVGLSNVDNTSDVNKPVSNAVQTALNAVNQDISDINALIPSSTSSTNQLTNNQQVDSKIGDATTTFKLNSATIASITANAFTDSEVNYVLSKSDVGLSNVDNTSDVNKPISSATQTALNAVNQDISDINALIPSSTSSTNQLTNNQQVDSKIGDATTTFKLNSATIASITANSFTDSEIDYVLSKSDVGLSNVDNTSDVNKPVSTAVQTALNAVNQDISDINALIPSSTSSSNQLANNQQVDDKIGDATTTFKLNSATIASITANSFTDSEIDYVLSKSDVGLSNVDNTSDVNKPVSTAVQTALDTINSEISDLNTDKANASEVFTKTEINNNYQNLNQKDTTIPLTPDASHYPTTSAIKSYVDTLITEVVENIEFRGIFTYASNESLEDQDPAPENAIENDTVIDITNNNNFIVNDLLLLDIQPDIELGNGYYYDIQHFTFNHDQGGIIKYNANTQKWNYIVSNNSGADDVTIEINAQNNYQLKDASITSSKLDSSFLDTIVNVQADFAESDSLSDSYILNKPTNVSYFTNDAGYISETFMAVPDFSSIESINRITDSTQTWTADRTGFVSVGCCVDNQTGYSKGFFRINLKKVYEFYFEDEYAGCSNVLAVKKGDIISMHIRYENYHTEPTRYCYFIPPKFVKQNGMLVEKDNSYSMDEVKTSVTWIDGKPIYKKTCTFSNILVNSASESGYKLTELITINNADFISIEMHKAIFSYDFASANQYNDCYGQVPPFETDATKILRFSFTTNSSTVRLETYAMNSREFKLATATITLYYIKTTD